MMGLIFDDSILPSYWSTEMKKALAIHIEDGITVIVALVACASTHRV